jgi:hypothetical protein
MSDTIEESLMQLLLFDLIPNINPTVLKVPNPHKAQRLRDLADSMRAKIKDKLNPPIANQRTTARRARITRSIIQEGEKQQQIQSWLYAMADACEEGTLPDILAYITTKSQLQQLQIFHSGQWRDSDIKSFFDDRNGYNPDKIKRLKKAKLTNLQTVLKAIDALLSLPQPQPINPIESQIKQLEYDLIGRKIPYYFPTPKLICQQMVQLALLEEGMSVLEPTAGKGNLSEAIQEAVKVNLDVCEINCDLRELLKLKGFNVIANDCFQLTYPQWHRIIANPPFGKGLEVEHIYHYYNLLLNGGRLVVIVPESVEFSSQKVYKLFRHWLSDKCCLNQSLPDGAFLNSDRPTGVKTRILVIEKE